MLPSERQKSTQLSRSPRVSSTAAVGHFDQFPAISPSVGYLFGQETVAGASGNDEDAPRAAIPFKPGPGRDRQRPIYRRRGLARKVDYRGAYLS